MLDAVGKKLLMLVCV